MLFRNTPEKFGLIAKLFHWSVAILVLWMLSVGFAMVSIPYSADKLWVYALHKSFGILILMLMIGRVLWRGISKRPEPLPTHKRWEDILAKIVHFGLYICLFLMPLSGWLMSSAGGFPAEFFGLFALPPLMEKNLQIFALTRAVHTVTAFTILGLLALHFAGAFKHHFIDRDMTLQRMTSYKVGLWSGVLLALLAGFLWTAPLAIEFGWDRSEQQSTTAEKAVEIAAPTGIDAEEALKPTAADGWLIDLPLSALEFEATQYSEIFQGRFKNFGGKIVFDPAKLDEAYVDIWIDIASIDTGSPDRDGQARSGEWFDAENFPRALFVADAFEQTAPGQYIAHGALTIRNKPVMVDMPFSLEISESQKRQTALMQAEIPLRRLDFGIGQGQWQATDTIGDMVKIKIRVVAHLE